MASSDTPVLYAGPVVLCAGLPGVGGRTPAGGLKYVACQTGADLGRDLWVPAAPPPRTPGRPTDAAAELAAFTLAHAAGLAELARRYGRDAGRIHWGTANLAAG